MKIKRATVTISDDSKVSQLATVETHSTDVKKNVEHHQPYGLTANVGSGDGLVIEVNGTRFVVGVNKSGSRPTGLAAGEVMIWSAHGQKIHLKADGNIEISAAKTIINGNVHIEGTLTNNSINMTTHKHPESIGIITGDPQ